MASPASQTPVLIAAGHSRLPGLLVVPAKPRGLVLFAHGSGSGRNSPRNRAVATVLNQAGIGTLLFDLLSDEESADRRNVFDVALLAQRLEVATAWLRQRPEAGQLPMGYFGASTGAAAALVAAASAGDAIRAIVSRGGRPDLADAGLRARVRAAALFIVGARDPEVLDLNVAAMRDMTAVRELVVVPGATHLFEEPGALAEVSRLAAGWFVRYFGRASLGRASLASADARDR